MADNKDTRNNLDKSRVSDSEDYEVAYLSKKFKVGKAIVQKAIAEVGNNRKAVEEFLTAYKRGEPF